MSKQETAPKFKPGDWFRWASQAGGTAKVKQGEVIAILPSNGDLFGAVPKGTKKSHVMGSGRSLNLRYVVEVRLPPPPLKKGQKISFAPSPRYYAPLSVIDGNSGGRGFREEATK